MTCPFSSLCIKHVAFFQVSADYVLLTFPNHLRFVTHCINLSSNVVLTNSIFQGTFPDRSTLSIVALSQALFSVSLLNDFMFPLNHRESMTYLLYFLCVFSGCHDEILVPFLKVPSLASLILNSRGIVRAANNFNTTM